MIREYIVGLLIFAQMASIVCAFVAYVAAFVRADNRLFAVSGALCMSSLLSLLCALVVAV